VPDLDWSAPATSWEAFAGDPAAVDPGRLGGWRRSVFGPIAGPMAGLIWEPM
jgi:hypothetical protein